jgi:predicted aspartyl protease
MINGIIENGLYPRLRIKLASQAGPFEFKALFDSGFDGQLALPYFAANRLRLEIVRFVEVTYANGQKNEEIVCRGEISWHDELRAVEIVLSDDDEPAIGTALLGGCLVTMDFVNDTFSIDKST